MAVNSPLPVSADLKPVAGIELGYAEAGVRKANRKDLLVMKLAPGATIAGAVRPGTLVVLELDAARAHTPGRDVELMTGTWAQCPAAAFVPALLRVVWERAVATPATGKA